jgi:hypothetical protein
MKFLSEFGQLMGSHFDKVSYLRHFCFRMTARANIRLVSLWDLCTHGSPDRWTPIVQLANAPVSSTATSTAVATGGHVAPPAPPLDPEVQRVLEDDDLRVIFFYFALPSLQIVAPSLFRLSFISMLNIFI